MAQLFSSPNMWLAILGICGIFYFYLCLLKPGWGCLIFLMISGLSLNLPGANEADQGLTIQNIILLIILVVAMKDILADNKRLVPSRLYAPIITTIIVMIFSTLLVNFANNASLFSRLAELKRNMFYLISFIIFANVNCRRSSSIEFIVVLMASALFMSLYASYDFSNVIQMNRNYNAIQQNFSAVAMFGAGYSCTPIMAILVLLSIYSSNDLSPLFKYGIPLIVVTLALPLFYFFERGMIGMLGLGVLLWLGSQRRIGALFVVVLIGVMIFLASPKILSEQWMARVNKTLSWGGGANLTIDTTNRLEYNWPRAIEMIQESFPMGIGLGNDEAMEVFPHNQFMKWLVDLGVPGFAALIWLLLAIWKELGRHLGSPVALYQKVAEGLRLFFLSFLFYSLFNDPFFYSWLYFLFALMGLMINPSIVPYHFRQSDLNRSYEKNRFTGHYSPNL
jgi:hypothetical protein